MLREAWLSMSRPIAVFLDASRFDQHVSKQALEWEHSVYNHMYQNDPVLQRLLSWQTINRGFINCEDGRVKYSVEGCRASGDMNTALGNVLLMCAMMHSFLRQFTQSHRLINDGDDCVVIVESSELDKVLANAKQWFLELGFTMKIEGYTDTFEKIDFCGSRPVYDGERWVMCRDPRVTLAKDLVSVRPIRDQVEWARQCTAIGECGLALAGNLPVFSSFYSMLDLGVKTERQLLTGMDYLAQGMSGKRRPVHHEARLSFYQAFDLSPDEQTALEEHYDAMTLQYHEMQAPWDTNERHTTEQELLIHARE
jgi:hypothetical protein